ncbi:MAG: MBL fold metallo-hydrolase [Spirochaetales bacterium]|jgi:glyoxylase-like metal-dependent hydrolase (beta-lactamase superfamily II)|nr:MBL fold metallo-hydrolase [Spirochaetales bacterium]
MKLTEGLWVIGGGGAGFGLTNPFDCNVYLVKGNGGYVLIDCGCGLEAHRVKDRLLDSGFRPKDCRAILLTHAHADHAGGAAGLAAYTGSLVYALAETASYVSEANREAISLPQAIKAGVYPADYVFSGCPVNPASDGEVLEAAGLEFRAIATPGHCSGHCAWLTELAGVRYLFSGDLIFPGGAISLQPLWDCSPLAYSKSVEKLMNVDFEALIPSHHGVMLKDGKEAVRRAHACFEKLVMPPGPV